MGTSRICIIGKNEKKKPNKHNRITTLTLPLLVSKEHKRITIWIDIFYVNGIPFFLSKTGKLNFLSGIKLTSRSGREITNAIDRN